MAWNDSVAWNDSAAQNHKKRLSHDSASHLVRCLLPEDVDQADDDHFRALGLADPFQQTPVDSARASTALDDCNLRRAKDSRGPAIRNQFQHDISSHMSSDSAVLASSWSVSSSSTPRREFSIKRDDGSRRSIDNAGTSETALAAATAARDRIFSSVRGQHQRLAEALQSRLAAAQSFRSAWLSGNSIALADQLEKAVKRGDEALAACALRTLQEGECSLSPLALSRLLPVVHLMSQSKSEDTALVAMRFVLRILQVSWPFVVKALRTVATPPDTWRACEEVVSRLTSFSAAVKAMSKSVRISRTNGPLVPVCRKLELALKEALAERGRPLKSPH